MNGGLIYANESSNVNNAGTFNVAGNNCLIGFSGYTSKTDYTVSGDNTAFTNSGTLNITAAAKIFSKNCIINNSGTTTISASASVIAIANGAGTAIKNSGTFTANTSSISLYGKGVTNGIWNAGTLAYKGNIYGQFPVRNTSIGTAENYEKTVVDDGSIRNCESGLVNTKGRMEFDGGYIYGCTTGINNSSTTAYKSDKSSYTAFVVSGGYIGFTGYTNISSYTTNECTTDIKNSGKLVINGAVKAYTNTGEIVSNTGIFNVNDGSNVTFFSSSSTKLVGNSGTMTIGDATTDDGTTTQSLTIYSGGNSSGV